MGTEKLDVPPPQRPPHAWLVGIGSSILATACLAAAQPIFNHLLTVPGYVGQEFKDRASEHAVTVGDWISVTPLLAISMSFASVLLWLLFISENIGFRWRRTFRLTPIFTSLFVLMILAASAEESAGACNLRAPNDGAHNSAHRRRPKISDS
jgi:hypothetical protein